MADRIDELRPKAADSEKITINLGHVDLGQIDLLVQEGFYSNRTDVIRTAIRNQLERHTDALKQAVARKKVELGLHHFSVKIWKRCVPPDRCSISACWDWPASQTASLPSLRARQ